MTTESQLLGTVLQVPDKWWGFEAIGRDRHPGICIQELAETNEWNVLKGSGAMHKRSYSETQFLIEPTPDNGLTKLTAFDLRPRTIRTHRLRNLIPDNVVGRLSNGTMDQLLREMIRVFGP